MSLRIDNFACPSDEIASYIDGELDSKRELELDVHFSQCSICAGELNQQKLFLRELDSTLKHEGELALPANFAKTVVANAESTVSGLRRPKERFNAIFIVAGLCLFVLFALGTDAARFLDGVSVLFDQILAVVGFFGRLVYSAFIGIAIILRSFAAQVRYDLVVLVVLTATMAVPLAFISRKVLRLRRA